MLIELYVKASVAIHTLAPTAADPYPPLCDGYHILNPIFAFFIGEVKGVLPTTFFAVLFFASLGAIFAISKKVKQGSLKMVLFVIAGALAMLGLWDFVATLSPSPCLGK